MFGLAHNGTLLIQSCSGQPDRLKWTDLASGRDSLNALRLLARRFSSAFTSMLQTLPTFCTRKSISHDELSADQQYGASPQSETSCW